MPWVAAQAALLGGFGALWLLAWARAARPPLEKEVAEKEESKREAVE